MCKGSKGSRLFEISCSTLMQARSVEGPTALSPFLVSLPFCFLPKIIYEFLVNSVLSIYARFTLL